MGCDEEMMITKSASGSARKCRKTGEMPCDVMRWSDRGGELRRGEVKDEMIRKGEMRSSRPQVPMWNDVKVLDVEGCKSTWR